MVNFPDRNVHRFLLVYIILFKYIIPIVILGIKIDMFTNFILKTENNYNEACQQSKNQKVCMAIQLYH